MAQRIFKYSDIQYTILTPDKILYTVWYIERYSMSTYTGVSNFQKTPGFLAHPVNRLLLELLHARTTHLPDGQM